MKNKSNSDITSHFLKVKQIYVNILLIVILLISSDCKKSGRGYVEGFVLDDLTKKPLEAHLQMDEAYKGDTTGLGELETNTDANGYFKISYLNSFQKNKKYIIHASSQQAFTRGSREIILKKENVTILLKPLAYLRLIVNNKTDKMISNFDYSINDKKRDTYVNPSKIYIDRTGKTTWISNKEAIGGNMTNAFTWTATVFYTNETKTGSGVLDMNGRADTLNYTIDLN